MKIAYLNARYQQDGTSGGNAHIAQFVSNVVALGHEIWMDSKSRHPLARPLPELDLLHHLTQMDVIYVRISYYFPEICRRVVGPNLLLFSSTLIVWEFNASPSFAALKGKSDSDIERTAGLFKQFGAGCDLAICVSKALAGYVRNVLGLNHVVTITNGSDPELFRQDVVPVPCVPRGADSLNVVWIGSAHLAWHNLDLVRRTAQFLWDRHRDSKISFHLIGRGLEKVQELPPNVTYHGPVIYHCLPRWLVSMHVGLVLYHPGPADYNSPLKLYDYMASGLAVVGSHHPQLCDIFSECGQQDMIVSTNDPRALAGKLLELFKSPGRASHYGRLARKLVIEKYSWRKIAITALDEISLRLSAKEVR